MCLMIPGLSTFFIKLFVANSSFAIQLYLVDCTTLEPDPQICLGFQIVQQNMNQSVLVFRKANSVWLSSHSRKKKKGCVIHVCYDCTLLYSI